MENLNSLKFNLQIQSFKLRVVKEKDHKGLVKMSNLKSKYKTMILRCKNVMILKNKLNVKKNLNNLKS